jgi:hypothetical protein
MSAAYAAGMMRERSRSRRDTLLLAGGATLVGAGIFVLIEAILALIDELQGFDPAGFKVAAGTDLLAACLTLGAFSLLIPAFLARSSPQRATLLGVSLALIGGAAAAMLTSDLLRAVESAVHHATSTYVAHAAVSAFADVVVLTAATIGAVAFTSSASSPLVSGRDGKLGWAASVFGFSLLFSMVSGVLLLIFFSDNQTPSGMTSGIGVGVASDAVEIAAAVLAAVAFFLAQQRQARALPWLASRDGLLGLAAAILVLSFLLAGIGKLIYAGAISSYGFDGKTVAAAWLDGIASLVELAAATCVAVGFLLSRRTGASGILASGTAVGPSLAGGGEAASFCSDCGAPRVAGTRFCNSCGHAF